MSRVDDAERLVREMTVAELAELNRRLGDLGQGGAAGVREPVEPRPPTLDAEAQAEP